MGSLARKNLKKVLFLVFLILGTGLSLAALALQTGPSESDPFSIFYDEGPHTVNQGQIYLLSVSFQIPEKYYLYEESIDFVFESLDGIIPGESKKPEAILKDDPFLGRVTPVFYNEATIEVPLVLPSDSWVGEKIISGEIQYQGCSDQLCYRLMHLPFRVSFVAADETAGHLSGPVTAQDEKIGFLSRLTSLIRTRDFSQVAAEGVWLSLLIAFIGGLLTDLTPCVWPMIPITLAIIGVRKDKTHWHNLAAVGMMVLGMSVMYSLLGLLAAGVGRSLGFLFQNIVFLIFLEIVLIFMALSLLGLYDIRLPAALQARLTKIPATGYRGIFFVGLTMGLFCAPCVGPVVGPLLVYVAQTKNMGLGFWLLLSYALGMGFLFFVLGVFYGTARRKIGSGVWNVWLKRILGGFMILIAVYYGQAIYGQITSVASVVDASWATSLDDGLARAAKENKPVVIDFFARWCPPCIELDHKVWEQPVVRKRLDEKWVAVKIDCTQDTEKCRQAVDRFQVIGWPTVIFLDRQQKEIEKERLVGTVVTEKEMEEILKRIEEK